MCEDRNDEIYNTQKYNNEKNITKLLNNDISYFEYFIYHNQTINKKLINALNINNSLKKILISDYSSNNIVKSNLVCIFNSIKNKNITLLALCFLVLNDSTPIVEYLTYNTSLITFIIGCGTIKNIKPLIETLKYNTNIKSIGLKSFKIKCYNYDIIPQYKKLYAIKEILKVNTTIERISFDSFNVDILEYLFDTLKNTTTINSLLLSDCLINKNLLIKIFKENTSIICLQIMRNNIHNLQFLIDILKCNHTLKIVKLKFNKITDITPLLDFLENNFSSVKYINLKYNYIQNNIRIQKLQETKNISIII